MSESRTMDRRVQRTRQLLREALFSLIIERGYECIAIQDITEQANLGRTTFYLHYHDKEELLKESIKALFRDMRIEVESDAEELCTYRILSTRIFEHIGRRQQLYRAMLKDDGLTSHIWEGMRSYFSALCQRFLERDVQNKCSSPADNGLFAAHVAGSLFGLISWWLKQEAAPSAEQMATAYCRLIAKAGEIPTFYTDA